MPRFTRFAVRDLGLLALTIGAWRLDAKLAAGHPSTGGARAVGVATGLLTALIGFATHEWGHLAGAVGSGGVVHEPERLSSVFLFFFDVEKSDRRSFLAMSYGGYAGSALATLAIAALVPRDRLSGKVALTAATLGALVTLALEVPTTVSVARGGAFPSGGVYRGTPAR